MIKNTLPETSLTLSDFNYDLPESRIAQTPLEPRDSSRLMIIDRTSDQLEHRIFRDIVDYLRPGDTLVVNDTRVIPARIIGHRAKKMMPDGTLVKSEYKEEPVAGKNVEVTIDIGLQQIAEEELAKTIEKLIPDAGLCVIKGTGHFSFCEKPYEANAIINSFI